MTEFRCRCGWVGEPFHFRNRPKVVRCRECRADTQLSVNAIDYRKLVESKGKRCPACTKHKQADEFSVARDRCDGRAGYCRLCTKQRYAETKRRYERESRNRTKKSVANELYRAVKKFRATTEAMDKLYPSHFVRNA